MSHYEQCCARECEWCAKGVQHGREWGNHICTSPSREEFTERCAEALKEIIRVFNGAGDTEASETMPDKMYGIASRALGLEK